MTVAHGSKLSVGDLAALPQGGVGDVLRALGGGVVFSSPPGDLNAEGGDEGGAEQGVLIYFPEVLIYSILAYVEVNALTHTNSGLMP